MRRAGFALGLLIATMVSVSGVVHAQQPDRVPRVGVLAGGASPSTPQLDAFRAGMRERGYLEGRNVVLEFRLAGGVFDRLPALAVQLTRAGVDVIVADSTAGALAAQRATKTIPIVAFIGGDPVKVGLA